MSEIIYVLLNEAMPGYVKVGKTDDLEQRIRSLDNTSIPLPFECYYACKVEKADFAEKQLFEAFKDNRVRSSREFFRISPERIVAILKLIAIEDVTLKKDVVENKEDQEALDKARRSNFNFEMVGIPVGSELKFVNDESIIAKVIGKKSIEYNGETLSLSGAAQKIFGVSYPVQGTLYWKFNNETLDERRYRIESEE